MNVLIITLFILTFLLIGSLFKMVMEIYYTVENSPKKHKEDEIVLKPLKEKPKFHEVDGSYDLVKNIFKSIDTENWDINIDEKSYWFPDKLYIITLINPQKSIMLIFNVRIDLKSDGSVKDVYIGDLAISNTDEPDITIATKSKVVTNYYKTDYNNDIKRLVYEKAWDIIGDKHNREFDIEEKIFKDMIIKTNSKLKTLNRMDRLKDIFS
jgi:hypothetical protein